MFKNYVYNPQYIVAEDHGKIIGFAGHAQSWMDYHIYQIFWVNVVPELQRKGMGNLLIKNTISMIKNIKGHDKANAIFLTTRHPKFYKKFGFNAIDEFRKDNYLMMLKID